MEELIYTLLKNKGFNEFAIAGIMGNIRAESGFKPDNMQNSYEKKLGYNDQTYTTAVDSGKYVNFAKDQAGYGLCQWTYWTRKRDLLEFARSRGVSISEVEMQIDFMIKELTSNYKGVYNILINTKTIEDACDFFMTGYERPADQSEKAKETRRKYAREIYNKHNKLDLPKPETSPISGKTTKEIALEVIQGKWGNGQERKDRLKEAGYNYSAVQRQVNAILKNK